MFQQYALHVHWQTRGHCRASALARSQQVLDEAAEVVKDSLAGKSLNLTFPLSVVLMCGGAESS